MTPHCFACLGARAYYVARFNPDGSVMHELKPCRQCAEPELLAVVRSSTREGR
jgi:hypothetical protein